MIAITVYEVLYLIVAILSVVFVICLIALTLMGIHFFLTRTRLWRNHSLASHKDSR